MRDVTPTLKPFGACPCVPGCGLEGKYQRTKRKDGEFHVRGCPCKRCKGARIKRGGSDGQRDSARRAGVQKVGSIFAGHEEHYRGPTRIEVKTGAQVKPMVTAFDKHKGQSEASRPIGDTRPFVLHVRPLPHGKRQITSFDSYSDREYVNTVEAMALQVGLRIASGDSGGAA